MRAKSLRYLVTGGAGFIGRRVVDKLMSEPGVEAMVLDDLSVGLPMPTPRAGLFARRVDIRDAAGVKAAMQDFRPEVVLHLAAVHHIPTCEKRRAHALDVNVVGTETVLEAAAEAGVGRFVLASSGAVYAWSEGPLDEAASPLDPCDNYALAKFANEAQTRLWADRTAGEAIVARLFNAVGGGDPNAHLLPDICDQIPAGARRVEIRVGNLTPRRDYIHVDDVARALVGLAALPCPPGVETFNVATGTEISVAQLVAALADAIGVEIDVVEDPARKRRVDRPSQCGAVDKIGRRLGFAPRRSLREALSEIAAQANEQRAVAPMRQ